MTNMITYITRKRIINGREYTTLVPDYSKLGTPELVKVEVDEIEALCWVRGGVDEFAF